MRLSVGFPSSAIAGARRKVGKTHVRSAASAKSPSRLRLETTGLVRLAGTSIVSRCRQNELSCGFRPASIAVAQGP